jgi:hypothetical protein
MNSLRLRFSEVWLGLLLIAGFGAAGFTSGFMVGGSATPVVGAILPAIISAISAGVVAFFQSQIKTGEEAITLDSRRRQIGWVGGFMLVFFLLYFFGLYYGIQARTTYWAVGRRLLPRAMRKQVKRSDLAQAFYRLDLYHALQSQGLCDRDAADFVERNFSPNYILVPREFLRITYGGEANISGHWEACELFQVTCCDAAEPDLGLTQLSPPRLSWRYAWCVQHHA